MYGGGSERQILSLLRHLDRDRFNPYLYLANWTGPLLEEIPEDVPTASFDRRWRGPLAPRLLMHRRRVRDMSQYLREVNAHVCYDRTFLMTLIAADAGQRTGVPNISTIVTDPALGFYPVAGRFGWIKRRILRRLYSRSTFVLANSDGAARSAESFYGLSPGSVQTLYNGIDVESVLQQSRLPLDDPWWTEEATKPIFRIATAGRLNHEKGFHLLIDAVATLHEQNTAEFRVAILGEGGARKTLQSQIDRAGLTSQIRLTGFRSDAVGWYRHADLFVLPSLLEGMPNVLLEAMACGTPVLSSDCPSGPREILDNESFGFLCRPGSADSLASKLREIIDSPEQVQSKANKAIGRVSECFSAAGATRQLEEFLLKASKRTQ